MNSSISWWVNRRGRRDKAALSEQIADLAARLYSLEEQARRAATRPAEKPAAADKGEKKEKK